MARVQTVKWDTTVRWKVSQKCAGDGPAAAAGERSSPPPRQLGHSQLSLAALILLARVLAPGVY